MANFMPVAYGAVVAFGVVLAIKGPAKAPDPISETRARTGPTVAAAAPAPTVAPAAASPAPAPPVKAATEWAIPDTDKLPDDTWGRTVR